MGRAGIRALMGLVGGTDKLSAAACSLYADISEDSITKTTSRAQHACLLVQEVGTFPLKYRTRYGQWDEPQSPRKWWEDPPKVWMWWGKSDHVRGVAPPGEAEVWPEGPTATLHCLSGSDKRDRKPGQTPQSRWTQCCRRQRCHRGRFPLVEGEPPTWAPGPRYHQLTQAIETEATFKWPKANEAEAQGQLDVDKIKTPGGSSRSPRLASRRGRGWGGGDKEAGPLGGESPTNTSVEQTCETSHRLSFLIRSTYDTLPCPQNLHRGFGREEGCALCSIPNASLQARHVSHTSFTRTRSGNKGRPRQAAPFPRWRHYYTLLSALTQGSGPPTWVLCFSLQRIEAAHRRKMAKYSEGG